MTFPMLTRYTAYLEKALTPARLQHSLGVMQVMSELTPIYTLEEEKALYAGLLHDAAKDLTPQQQVHVVQEGRLEIDDPTAQDYSLYLHGPAGAFVVARDLGVTDPLVLDAIAMHTWCVEGPNFHDPLVWCLRFADLLEPYRNWDGRAQLIREGTPRLRELVYAGKLYEGAVFQSVLVERFFSANGWPVHPNFVRVQREFAGRVKS